MGRVANFQENDFGSMVQTDLKAGTYDSGLSLRIS